LFLSTMWIIGIIMSAIIQYNSRINYLNRTRVENLSITDSLTGLHNRHFFESVA
jgi:PleD family two-component response regulator